MIATRSIGSVNSASRSLSHASGREFSPRVFSPGITKIPGTERRMPTSPNYLTPKSGRDFLNLPRFNPGLPKSVHEGPVGSVNIKNSKEFSPTLPPGINSHIQSHRPMHHEPLRRITIRPSRENVPNISKPRILTPLRSEIINQTDGQNGLNMLSILEKKRTELRRRSSEPEEALAIQKRDSKILKINPVVEIFSIKTHNQNKLRKAVESKTDEKREFESDPKANEGRRKLLKGLFRKLKKEHVTVGKLPTGADITRYVPTTPDDSLISEIVKGTKKDGSWSALVGTIGKMKVFSETAIDSLIKSLTAVRRRPKVVDPVGPDAVRLVLSGSNARDKQKTA